MTEQNLYRYKGCLVQLLAHNIDALLSVFLHNAVRVHYYTAFARLDKSACAASDSVKLFVISVAGEYQLSVLPLRIYLHHLH